MSALEVTTKTYVLSSDTQTFSGTAPPSSIPTIERYIWMSVCLVIVVVIVGFFGCTCYCFLKNRQREKSGKGSATANDAELFYISDGLVHIPRTVP